MKNSNSPCQFCLSENVVYKEVAVIGNGPSGMVTSFMLAGNVPYLREVPDDLPIDDMFKARLSNVPTGDSLYDVNLSELAEGLEGRSQNPIPLLMDNLLRPCADLGVQADSLIEWKYEPEKQIDHVVLGRGPAGGAWHTFPAEVRTLSPAAWLSLPPHSSVAGGGGGGRLSARAVANYCKRYVHACNLQKYFKSGVCVRSVQSVRCSVAPCSPRCPLNARFLVTCSEAGGVGGVGSWAVLSRRVVIACGAHAFNSLEGARPHALHALRDVARALRALRARTPHAHALVVGSGVSAADALHAVARNGLTAHHVYRTPAPALASLSKEHYPDYHQVYNMMCEGPSKTHQNYIPHPDHAILDITPLPQTNVRDEAIRLKRVKLLNLVTKQVTEITVAFVAVLIGAKPDLSFLQTDLNSNSIDIYQCIDNRETVDTIEHCIDIDRKPSKRKMNDQCFLKNNWHTLKSILGQSIQSCKSRYLSYTRVNENEQKISEDCDNRKVGRLENVNVTNTIEYEKTISKKGRLENNKFSKGIGFGVDEEKPVDCRSNPVAIDKGTHELLNGPQGMYALGPVTADNFIRFIPGGALAFVSHIHKQRQTELL